MLRCRLGRTAENPSFDCGLELGHEGPCGATGSIVVRPLRNLTPAGRLEEVMRLLHPVDELGNALEPFITIEQAARLLDIP